MTSFSTLLAESMPFAFSADYGRFLVNEHLVPFLLKLATAIVVYVIGKWAAKKLTKLSRKVLRKAGLDETLSKFVGNVIYGLLLAVVIIIALERLGVKTTAAVAILGAAGLAVGLALKDSLGNFASGVMVMLFKPFKVGDVVKVGGGIFGKVEEVATFSTIVITPQGKKVIVPNGKITSDVIENWSDRETVRVDMTFGIGYDDDIDKAKAILTDLVSNHPKAVVDPKPTIAVAELGDSSVNIVCRPWSTPEDYWDVYFDITESAKKEFDKAGITIPFPQRDVHMYQAA